MALKHILLVSVTASLMGFTTAHAQAPNCATLLKETEVATEKAARTWNAFIEAFNKYAFQPDYSNSGQGLADLRTKITEIRSLQANASGYMTQATQLNCNMASFQASQNALQDIATQLTRAEIQLRN